MSAKQNVLNILIMKIFANMEAVEEDTPLYFEVQRHKREITAYIQNTLNLEEHAHTSMHCLHPRLYEMLRLRTEQQTNRYMSNPINSDCVQAVLAFKMVVGE